MALTTAQIQAAYVTFFNRPADVAGLNYWSSYQGSDVDLYNTFAQSDEYTSLFTGLNNTATVTAIYQNLFGHNPDLVGLDYWVGLLDNGVLTIGTIANAIYTGAQGTDKIAAESKASAATTFTVALDTPEEVIGYASPSASSLADVKAWLAGVTSVATLATQTSDAVLTEITTTVANGAQSTGETFTLTVGADNIPGTSGNDTITSGETLLGLDSGDPIYGAHLQSTDVISGGAGADTLKVTTEGAIEAVLPTMTGVEKVELSSGNAITFNTSDYADVTLLSVTKANGDVELTAAATADISISGVSAEGDIDAVGGKNITVTDASANNDITVGDAINDVYAAGSITVTDSKQGTGIIVVDGGTAVTVTASATAATGNITVGANQEATGAVVVTQNLTSTGDALDNSAKTIAVTGGTTVNVTVNGTITADAAVDNTHALTSTAVVVNGDGTTTDVTVAQNLTATDYSKAGAAEVVAKQVLTFKALAIGETTTVDGLTFTASKALNAAQVAEAFAGLTASDKQDAGGPTANGFYTGNLSADWTSAAASGDSVTFTAKANNTDPMTVTVGAIDPASVYTLGTAAGAVATADVSVAYSDVTIDDAAAAAIKNITLSGFKDADLGGSVSLDALETLTLTKSAGDTVLQTAQTALALNVNAITGSIDLDNSTNDQVITDLTLTATGVKSAFDLTAAAVTDATIDAQVALDLSGAQTMTALENATIKGAGAVNLGDISTYVALDSFNAAANTGGITATVEAEIAVGALTGSITEYVFSAGADTITLKDTIIETKITLGEGNDKLTLAAGTVASAAALDGGTGTNTIAMAAADAETLSNTNAFEAKMSNFSKLSLLAVATETANAVDLANMDEISYVITAGAADEAQVTDFTITVDNQLAAGDTDDVSIVVAGKTYSASNLEAGADADADAQVIAAALATAIDGEDGLTAVAAAGVLTITGADGKFFTVSDLTLTGTGEATGESAITSSALVLDNMADAGTVELAGAATGVTVNMTDASGDADSLNVKTLDDAAGINLGTVLADGVETINVTTQDTFIDIEGDLDIFGADIANGVDDDNSSVVLTLSGDALETVSVTGAGDVNLSTVSTLLTSVNAATLTGALTYTADGATAGTTVIAGSGADTLIASGENDVLKGSDGKDTITAGDLTQVYGGAGADTFKFAINSNLTKVSTINDLASGDTINLVDVFNTNAVVDKFYAAGAQYNANTTTDVPGKVNAALVQTGEGEASWFNHGGNTYVVIDASGDSIAAGAVDAYDEGNDIVIEIIGTFNLGTGASFNSQYGTLEIV